LQSNRVEPCAVVVAVEADAVYVRALERFLDNGGIETAGGGSGIETADGAGADVAVVVISRSAVTDAEWKRQVADHRFVRLVPVRVDDVSSGEAAQLRSLNWIEWDHDAPVTTFGRVLAAVLTDPQKLTRIRTLRAEADSWARTGFRGEHLIGDHRKARDADRFLREMDIDEHVAGNETVAWYVRQSRIRTARARRWALTRQWGAALVAAVVALAIAVAIPLISNAEHNNFSAVVTTGDRRAEQQEPEWSSLLAGALLLNGDEAQQNLGRLTLADTLSVPWSRGTVDVGAGYSLEGMEPLGDGSRSVLLFHDRASRAHIGIFDVKHLRVLDNIVPTGVGQLIAVDGSVDGRTAVAAGPDGLLFIDVRTMAVRHVRLRLAQQGLVVRLLADGRVAVANDVGQLELIPAGGATPTATAGAGATASAAVETADASATVTAGPTVHRLGSFLRVLSLERTSDGGARAVVERSKGVYALVDAVTGRVLAQGRVPEPLVPTGGVSPDEPFAVVTGADHQLWRLAAGRAPAPTGIAVSDRTYLTVVLSHERVAVGGQDEPMRVLHLPTRSDLGVICREVPSVNDLRPSADGNVVDCLGLKIDAIWPVPQGPVAGPSAGSTASPAAGPTAGPAPGPTTDRTTAPLSATPQVSAHGVRVESRGNRLRISGRTATGTYTSDWLSLFASGVSAVAVSPDGQQIVAGSTAGGVAVVRAVPPRAWQLVTWQVPDGSAVRALGWRGADPLVRAADGNLWTVPGCPGCSSDQGLINQLIHRMRGCWSSPAQLQSIDSATRRRLGVSLCGAVPPAEER
jgi:hypothetical protein